MAQNSTIIVCLSAALLISAVSATEAKRSRPSAAECDAYAHNYAWDQSRQGQVLAFTGLSSLGGFALGSIWAASGLGAAIGAGLGLIGGLVVRIQDADQIYGVAYRECMTGRVLR